MQDSVGVVAMVGTDNQIKSLVEVAKELKLEFFLVSFTDILGATRAKLVPAAKIATVASDGAFFAHERL